VSLPEDAISGPDTEVFRVLRDQIRQQITDAYDLTPEEREFAAAPWPGERRARAREVAYRASLPRRMQAAADDASERYADLLPDGMQFEWVSSR